MAENLARMGNATVRRINLGGTPVIHKQNVSIVELYFYKYVAQSLSHKGLGLPLVYELNTTTRSVSLEYIPYSITQNELRDNIVFLQMLSVVHAHPLASSSCLHQHHWSDNASDITNRHLNLCSEARSVLRKIKTASDILFCSEGVISGDSNAGNWGRRANGDIVLFDWERFGQGSPAIDLAPLIKGMGTHADYYAIAERYCRINRQYKARALSREIAICKAWVVTEVMMLLFVRKKPALSLYTQWYKKNFPCWLSQISKFI